MRPALSMVETMLELDDVARRAIDPVEAALEAIAEALGLVPTHMPGWRAWFAYAAAGEW
jgi:hypothetical protein